MMRNSIPCFGIIRIRCKGFDLSLSFNPQADKAPLLVSAAKIGVFLICWSETNKITQVTEQRCHQSIDNLSFGKTPFAFGKQRQRGVAILRDTAG